MNPQYDNILDSMNDLCKSFYIIEDKNSIKIVNYDKITKKNINKYLLNINYKEYNNIQECCICLTNINHNQKIQKLFNCKHLFHKKCIEKWILKSQKKICPICNL